jgi:hypothetical protein
MLTPPSDIGSKGSPSVTLSSGKQRNTDPLASLYAALLYAYTPEAFPAPVRGSASGMLSTLGRIASIVSHLVWMSMLHATPADPRLQVAPIAAGQVYNGSSSPGVLYLAVSLILPRKLSSAELTGHREVPRGYPCSQ